MDVVTLALAKKYADSVGIKPSIVDSLPTKGEAGKLYLVKEGENTYLAYMYVDSKFVPIGNTIMIDVDEGNESLIIKK